MQERVPWLERFQAMPNQKTNQVWDPKRYAKEAGFVSALGLPVVELLAPKSGERILDLGCGDGTLALKLMEIGCEVVGVDASSEFVAAAREKGVDARRMDGQKLLFDHEFDAVFSNAALHWIPEAETVIEGVLRALKSDGRFVAEFGGKGNVRTVVTALENALTCLGISPVGANPWYYPSVAKYASLLERHGLEVYEAALFERPTRLEGGEQGFATWVKMFCGSFLERVPEHQHANFIRSAEQSARPKLWKNDHWEFDYRRLRIAARKIRQLWPK